MTTFLKKYPLPWVFERTDRDGGGAIRAANGQIMFWMKGDMDWDDDLDEDEQAEGAKRRPVMTRPEVYGQPSDEDIAEIAEHEALIAFLLERINGDAK